jgi:hypothetical protein
MDAAPWFRCCVNAGDEKRVAVAIAAMMIDRMIESRSLTSLARPSSVVAPRLIERALTLGHFLSTFELLAIWV